VIRQPSLVALLFGLLAAPVLPAQEPRAAGQSAAAPRFGPDYRIVFPNDPAVLNVKRECGAKGDGVSDDTDALQKALDAGSGRPTRVVYLPVGVYRVTRSLVVKSALGPWLYGELRDQSIIRLADGVADCTAVLRTHPRQSGKTSSDWFMRNIRNLTIDVGNNPQVDGIRYYATNSGIIQNVTVKGRGKIGVNSSFLGESGPNMVEDTLVEGFETGLACSWVYGQTLSRVTVRNCRKQGVVVAANAVAIEDLSVENTPLALSCEVPNNWGHWGGVVALVGGRFTGGKPDGPAISNNAVLYARNVRTAGFKMALESTTPGGSVAAPEIKEYSSHPVKRLFSDAPDHAIALPIKPEPVMPWEANPANWVCVSDFGAVAGDNKDDTQAFQKAIDAAAAAGKTTVYVRGIGGPDPNWYTITGDVRVHGSVRQIMGLGFGRLVASKSGGRFSVGDDAAPMVKFQNLDSFGGTPVTLENRSANRTMLVESCGVTILGAGSGDIFVTDCPAHAYLTKPGQKLWARHLNAEGQVEGGLVHNAGGDLWILGTKSENKGLRYRTSAGGRTEIFGAFQYSNVAVEPDDTRAMFEVDNGSLCVMGLREICHIGKPYVVKARERRGSESRELTVKTEGGWPGWALFSAWSSRPR
jgi:hypothetical protein